MDSYSNITIPDRKFFYEHIDDISIHQILVCLASTGWQMNTKINYHKNSNSIDIHIIMCHHEWHGTLCEVVGFNKFYTYNVYNKKLHMEEVYKSIKKDLVDFIFISKALWNKYTTSVPCITYGSRENAFSDSDDYDQKKFNDYKSGSLHVVMPSRMSPVLGLPGWKDAISLEDYLLREINDDWLLHVMKNIIVEDFNVLVHLSFSLDTYNGENRSMGAWNIGLFGFNNKYSLRMKHNTSVFLSNELNSVQETGDYTDVMALAKRNLSLFESICNDIRADRITEQLRIRD